MKTGLPAVLSRAGSFFDATPPGARLMLAFRIALGALVLVDAATRIPLAGIFLAESGLFPSALQEAARPSLFNLHGSAGWAVALLAIYGLCGAALVLGAWPRPAALLAWFLVLSLHHRNPCVTNGGDFLLRMALLWSVFLPLGAGWSILRRDVRPEPWLPGVWTIYRVQIAAVYVVTAIHKLAGGAWLGGDGLANALRLAEYARPPAGALAGQEALLPALSAAIVFGQLAAGLGLLLRPPLARAVSVAFLAGMHAAFLLCFDLGLFPWVGLVTLIPLVPWRSREPAVVCEPWGWRSAVATGVAAVTLSYAALSPFNAAADSAPERVLKLLGLNQRWTMFVAPSSESRRVAVVVGEGRDRRDLIREKTRGDGRFAGGPFDAAADGLYASSRWTAFLVALADGAIPGGRDSQRLVARRLGELYAGKYPGLAKDGWRVVVFTRDNRTGVAFHDGTLARSEASP